MVEWKLPHGLDVGYERKTGDKQKWWVELPHMKMATSDKKEELVWSGEDASNLRSLKFHSALATHRRGLQATG